MQDAKAQSLSVGTVARRHILFGGTFALSSLVFSAKSQAGVPEEISRSAEAIHDEVIFKATRRRVYEALTDASQFHKVVLLSRAATTGMVPIKSPAEISKDAGGAFAIFGGYVTGRHIEMVPNERLVQAWRNGSWKLGIYSIVKFELSEDTAGTKLVFDHTGFPVGDAQHLAEGWKSNYWEPLAKFLAQ